MPNVFERILLPVPEGFDFAQNLAYLERSNNECLFRTEGEAVYRALTDGRHAAVWRVSEGEHGLLMERLTEAVRVAAADPAEEAGRVVTEVNRAQRKRRTKEDVLVADAGQAVQVTGVPEGDSYVDQTPLLEVGRTVGESLSAAAIAYVRQWFDLERDLTPFYALADTDEMLLEPARRFYGLRLLGIPDLFEALCWGIIGQQINLAFAYTLKRRLVERYGRSIVCDGETYWLFPEPEIIAGLTVEELDPLRMTVRKSEYLIDTAAAVASGELSKERLLAAGDLKDAERLLVSRRGIGPWTAHYVIMRCLRYPDAFPIDDVGLHNAVKSLTGLDRKPTKPELLAMSQGWEGWEAYATFYLWRLLY